jgi:prevent-host-death family protein
MKQVNVHEAQTHLSRLLEEVEAGEEIIIGRDGRPIARLVPVERNGVRQPGAWKGKVQIEEGFDEPPAERDTELAQRLLAIGQDCAAHLREPYRSIDHAELLYDERGLPN